MKQENAVRFASEDTRIQLFCDANVSLGALHDFLMEVKGTIVERMVSAQKAEEEVTKKQKELDQESPPSEG